MPLFYFDVRDAGRLMADEDGQLVADLDAAGREAAESAAAIARDVLPARLGGEIVVEVRDEKRRRVLVVRVELRMAALTTSE
jgi:hypothetical protein